MTAATITETVSTREAWLLAGVAALAPIFEEAGETLPAVRVSVGFPGGRGKKGNVIGQCWATSASEDEVAQVFIHPSLTDVVVILATLAHEIVHAVDDCASGHRGRFAKIAKAIGLEGPMTATHAGETLKARLEEIARDLGDFPHAALIAGGASSGPKKQTTRMLKVECPADGYIVRTTAKWLEVGLPSCPCGETMEVQA